MNDHTQPDAGIDTKRRLAKCELINYQIDLQWVSGVNSLQIFDIRIEQDIEYNMTKITR